MVTSGRESTSPDATGPDSQSLDIRCKAISQGTRIGSTLRDRQEHDIADRATSSGEQRFDTKNRADRLAVSIIDKGDRGLGVVSGGSASWLVVCPPPGLGSPDEPAYVSCAPSPSAKSCSTAEAASGNQAGFGRGHLRDSERVPVTSQSSSATTGRVSDAAAVLPRTRAASIMNVGGPSGEGISAAVGRPPGRSGLSSAGAGGEGISVLPRYVGSTSRPDAQGARYVQATHSVDGASRIIDGHLGACKSSRIPGIAAPLQNLPQGVEGTCDDSGLSHPSNSQHEGHQAVGGHRGTTVRIGNDGQDRQNGSVGASRPLAPGKARGRVGVACRHQAGHGPCSSDLIRPPPPGPHGIVGAARGPTSQAVVKLLGSSKDSVTRRVASPSEHEAVLKNTRVSADHSLSSPQL